MILDVSNNLSLSLHKWVAKLPLRCNCDMLESIQDIQQIEAECRIPASINYGTSSYLNRWWLIDYVKRNMGNTCQWIVNKIPQLPNTKWRGPLQNCQTFVQAVSIYCSKSQHRWLIFKYFEVIYINICANSMHWCGRLPRLSIFNALCVTVITNGLLNE